MPHSPYYFFRGGVHISLLCPPSTCVWMCAVNAGWCVIDLLVQGWTSTCSLLCLVTGNGANTDNSPVSISPFCIPPYQAWGIAGRRWKITPDTLTLFWWNQSVIRVYSGKNRSRIPIKRILRLSTSLVHSGWHNQLQHQDLRPDPHYLVIVCFHNDW